MENLYSVRLEAVMRARKGENQSECQTDLVAEERWNCLQLLDWSHSGLIAVAVNKCSVESVNGASVLQHCAIALFDANEPHVVAIRCTEHHPNAVMDFLSSDDKETQNIGRSNTNAPSSEANGWLMSHCNFYTMLSWHPHTNMLAAVKNNSSIDIWSNLNGFIINDFAVHLSVDCSSVLNKGISKYGVKLREHFPVSSMWINCEFTYRFYSEKNLASNWNENGNSNIFADHHSSHANLSLSANKHLPLFDGNTCTNNLSSLDESCYGHAFGVVTSSGYLVVTVFNTYFDCLKESCAINASAQKHDTAKVGCIDNSSVLADSSENVTSALFFWNDKGRHVMSIQANGSVTITKFQLCLIETNHNNNYESLELIVESLKQIDRPSKDFKPLIVVHANADELVCLSEGSSRSVEEMQIDLKDRGGDLENIKREPSDEEEPEKIVLARFSIEKCSKQSQLVSVDGEKDANAEVWKVETSGDPIQSSVQIGSEELDESATILKVKKIGPVLGQDKAKFRHVCLTTNKLFDGTLLDEKSPNFLLCDSDSLQLFDNCFAKVEGSEFSNTTMFVKSKLATTKGVEKRQMGKMMCLSPLGLACAVYDPELERVEVSLLSCAIKTLSGKGFGTDLESAQLNSERLLKITNTLFVGGLCAGKDLWDLTMLLRRTLSHEQLFTCLQSIFRISGNISFWLEKVLFACNALAFKESNCSHPLTCFGLNLQMNLSMIYKFFRLIHNSVGTSLWTKFDSFIDTSGPDLVDAVILTEFEHLLIKETEFMLILPHIQYIYDNLLLLFECFAQKRFSTFVNLKALLLLFKNVLIFTTLWLSQSSLRAKHYPVVQKCTSSIDMKQFYSLVYQLNSVFSLGEMPIEETLQPIINKIQSFLRLFKPVILSQKLASLGCPHLTGIYSVNSLKNAVIVPRDMESVMTSPSDCSESMLDDVRFMRLGVRPIVSLKKCVKCGRKQGLRAKKQFKWPLWEAMFDQTCICGGLWRRENRKFNAALSNSISTTAGDNPSTIGANVSSQGESKSQNIHQQSSQISSQ